MSPELADLRNCLGMTERSRALRIVGDILFLLIDSSKPEDKAKIVSLIKERLGLQA